MRKSKILLAAIFFYGCSESADHGRLVFKDSISFEHIDFTHFDSEKMNEIFNSRIATVKNDDDDFLLHIVDVNKNGKFDDVEDAIMINSSTSLKPQNISFANKIKNENYFSINSRVFKISKIREINSKYEACFDWDRTASIDKVSLENRMIDRLPDLEYYNFKNEKIKFSSFLNKNKFIYIEFWALWCSPCLTFIPEINDLNEKYSNQLEIISISSDRQFDKSATYSYIQDQKMKWNQGFANQKINDELSFNFLPRGYLFDSHGKLIIYDASPKTVALFLKNLDKKQIYFQ